MTALENELRLFWRAKSALNSAMDAMSAQEAREEIASIAMHTAWPRLRDACMAALDRQYQPDEDSGLCRPRQSV